MIYIHDMRLRVVGNIVHFLDEEYSVQEFIQGDAVFDDDIVTDAYRQARTILVTNTNWGRNESQWEEALQLKDAEMLSLLARQGYSLNKVAEEALNFPGYIEKIHEAIYHYLEPRLGGDPIEGLDLNALFDSLWKKHTFHAELLIAKFAPTDSQVFNDLATIPLRGGVLFDWLERTPDPEYLHLMTHNYLSKNDHESRRALKSLLQNPNTDSSLIAKILSKEERFLNELELHLKKILEVIKEQDTPSEEVLEDVYFVLSTLLCEFNDSPEKREMLQSPVRQLADIAWLLKEKSHTDYEILVSELMFFDVKDVVLGILEREVDDYEFFMSSRYRYVDVFMSASMCSVHPDVLEIVWGTVKTYHSIASYEERFENEYAGYMLRGIDACTLALLHNPHTPDHILTEIQELNLPSVAFVEDNVGVYSTKGTPYHNFTAAVKARKKQIYNNL